MSLYYCNCCNYDAKVKSSYTKHINTVKHKKKLAEFSQKLADISNMKIDEESKKCSEICMDVKCNLPTTKMFECKYCDKVFKHH